MHPPRIDRRPFEYERHEPVDASPLEWPLDAAVPQSGRADRYATGTSASACLPAGAGSIWCWRWCSRAPSPGGFSRIVRIMRFHRLMKEIDPAPEEWQARTRELPLGWDLSKLRRLCLVPGRVPPMLWAIGGQARLLVPSELWLDDERGPADSLLLHELAHLKRRDHWVRWLELIVGGLYWWHPAVWWGRRLLREAEEQCCDAWVVWAMPQGAKTYATALLAAIEFVSGARTAPAASSAASGNGHVSCLKRRLKMIVRAQTPKGLSWAGRLGRAGSGGSLAPPGAELGPEERPRSGLTRTGADR